MATIDLITAEEIFDSRGTPTLSVSVSAGGAVGTFSVPSGASTGSHEALELRDGDLSYHGGKGVFKAIANVREVIAPALAGTDVFDQGKIDQILLALDGTGNKSRLGANALLGVSIAAAKAAAKVRGVELFVYLRTLADIAPSRRVPLLFMNLINGGMHAPKGHHLAFQEYHIVPKADSASRALAVGEKVEDALRDLFLEKFGETVEGDEGGFAMDSVSVAAPLVFLAEAASRAGVRGEIDFALDAAATSFFKEGKYVADGRMLASQELASLYDSLIRQFPIVSIEDPFAEEAFDEFSAFARTHPSVRIVGDDLTVTNTKRLGAAITQGSITTLLVKPNQIGTLSETLVVMRQARQAGLDLIVSHRSGETMDDFIADLVYAFGCYGLKAGAPEKAERRVKYERLVSISEQ